MSSRRLKLLLVLAAPALLGMLSVLVVLFARQGGMEPFQVPTQGSAPMATDSLVMRGQYLASIGNCIGCHTVPGGEVLAGGRAFRTDYGTIYSTNISSDRQYGIGDWSLEEFRHAMRHGVSRNGTLSPVFPYASFQFLADDDLDALLAYLRSSPASDRSRTPNDLEFPANLPGAMLVWRVLFYQPAQRLTPQGGPAARGEYLVRGIGHCATCHGARGMFASQDSGRLLWGNRIAGWFAPALHDKGLARFASGDVANYLRGGAPHSAGAYGLMADVISRNLQHLSNSDALAIEAYLRTLPSPTAAHASPVTVRASEQSLRTGGLVYERYCANCHGSEGEGMPNKYPALRRSTSVIQDDPINLVKLVLFGAVAPSTPSQTAPYTMPPFAPLLSDDEIAGVVNFLRSEANPDAMPIDAAGVRAMGGIDLQ